MKITLQHISDGQDEIIIRYRELTPDIQSLEQILRDASKGKEQELEKGRILGTDDGKKYIVERKDIIYFESVEGITYAYLEDQILRVGITLAMIEQKYEDEGFFRCSKSMVLNIYRIHSLKSEPGNRIDATMDNGEHIAISRRFAKELRARLKGEIR